MTAEASEHLPRQKKPRRSAVARLQWWISVWKFAQLRAASTKDSLRLFYYLALKPTLVWRGWRKYSPQTVLSFSINAAGKSRYKVHARDNGLEVGTIAEFFAAVPRVIPTELPPFQPRVIYDLGANVGIAALYFADLYPGATIYAFEPLPANFEICKLNCGNLRKARTFPWAVGEKNELASFECNDDPRGGHLKGGLANANLKTTNRIEVQVFSIAELVKSKKIEPADFIKLDVEGAEMEVLRGMGDEVAGVKRMFVETHGEELKAQCIRWLQERGFEIHASEDPTAVWGIRT